MTHFPHKLSLARSRVTYTVKTLPFLPFLPFLTYLTVIPYYWIDSGLPTLRGLPVFVGFSPNAVQLYTTNRPLSVHYGQVSTP